MEHGEYRNDSSILKPNKTTVDIMIYNPEEIYPLLNDDARSHGGLV